MLHYLDNAATTPVRPEALRAAMEMMENEYGNPSSLYALGTQAAARLHADRTDLARALGCAPNELFFTSGGTESNNWAFQATAEYQKRKGKHIISTAIEHAAVLEPARRLTEQGYEISYLKPDKTGHVSIDELRSLLRADTVLVSIMLVNNELGTLQPVAEAASAIRASDSPALLHCDAVQGFLKADFTPAALGVDLLSLSGHKIGAPKGIGALYMSPKLVPAAGPRLKPLLSGGGQEGGLRSGTEPTSLIAAFAAAAKAGSATRDIDIAHMNKLKAYAAEKLTAAIPGLELLASSDAPHILPITMPGYKSEVLVRFLSDAGIYVSSGSACHKGTPSHVYRTLGLPKPKLDGALRISFSPATTTGDIDALTLGLRAAQAQLLTALS